MDAELQTEGVDVVGERLQAGAVARGGESIFGGNEAAVGGDRKTVVLWIVLRIGDVPTLIDDDVLPAVAA